MAGRMVDHTIAAIVTDILAAAIITADIIIAIKTVV